MERVAAAVPTHPSTEHGTTEATLNPRGDAQTFLTHFVGGALEDDRYVIQRFVSKADGQIVPVHANGEKSKGRRNARRTIVTAKVLEMMRPARDEIIISTGVKLRNCGLQLWGWRSLSIFTVEWPRVGGRLRWLDRQRLLTRGGGDKETPHRLPNRRPQSRGRLCRPRCGCCRPRECCRPSHPRG